MIKRAPINTSISIDSTSIFSRSTLFRFKPSKLSGSRWGLKGAEDLGGGLQAVFTLEGGFRPSDGGLGQGGRLFGRSAYVGLGKKGLGTLTFGRQYEPITDLVAQYSGSGIWSPATHVGDNDNLNQ
ncbi:porin, partial [Burkholderia cenocepacia]|nr:porin [Burkholderia cenocepacia]